MARASEFWQGRVREEMMLIAGTDALHLVLDATGKQTNADSSY